MNRSDRTAFTSRAAGVLLLGMTWIFASPIHSQELAPPKAEIVAKVECKRVRDQSYSLYLPSNYTPKEKWPILYCFDPGARGSLPLVHFKEAAEKYGYILAGSNNSRNGANEIALAAINAMWDDTHARFSIDDRRIYAAGFSGGARVAAGAAYRCGGCVAGVIGCGAGFPPQMPVTSQLPFVFFATVGVDDFNFPELTLLARNLDVAGVPHRLAMFEGAHEWAPKEVCTRAIEWMEIQAMKTGARSRDESLIDAVLATEARRVRGLEEARNFYQAYLGYRALAADFKGLREVREFEEQAARSQNAKEVLAALREETGEIRQQREITEKFVAWRQKARDPREHDSALASIRSEMAQLRAASREEKDSSGRRVARRAAREVSALVIESGIFLRGENPAMAVTNLEIATSIIPDNPNLLFELAIAYAMNHDSAQAIKALRLAIEKGFNNLRRLEGSGELQPLRELPEFKKLIETLREKQGAQPNR